MRALALLALAGCVAGCGGGGVGALNPFAGGGLRGAPAEVQGVRFRTRTAVVREDPRAFAVTVRAAARAPARALEAGRTEGLRHCLVAYGGTEVAWTAGPDRPADGVGLRPDGTVVLTGRCLAR